MPCQFSILFVVSSFAEKKMARDETTRTPSISSTVGSVETPHTRRAQARGHPPKQTVIRICQTIESRRERNRTDDDDIKIAAQKQIPTYKKS